MIYVAGMSEWIGAGETMMLGGLLTWVAVAAAVVAIPAILTYPDGQLTAVPCDMESAEHSEMGMAADEIEPNVGKEDQRLVQLRLIQAQRREETD